MYPVSFYTSDADKVPGAPHIYEFDPILSENVLVEKAEKYPRVIYFTTEEVAEIQFNIEEKLSGHDGFMVTVDIMGAQKAMPNYPLLEGDLVLKDQFGEWQKVAPGVQVGGFVLNDEQEATLKPVKYENDGLLFLLVEGVAPFKTYFYDSDNDDINQVEYRYVSPGKEEKELQAVAEAYTSTIYFVDEETAKLW